MTRKGSYSPPKLHVDHRAAVDALTRSRLVYVMRRDGSLGRPTPPGRVAFTHEGSLSWRVGSILRDDREDTMVRMLMLLRRRQEVVVTTRMVLVADQGRAGCGGGGGGSRMMWWQTFAAQAQARGATQSRRRWPRYAGVQRRRRRGGSCSRYIAVNN